MLLRRAFFYVAGWALNSEQSYCSRMESLHRSHLI